MDEPAVAARYLGMRLLLVLAACACSSPKRPVGTPPSPAYPAPLYAGLFVDGARFSYAVESAHAYTDEQRGNVEDTVTGLLTCTVSEVRVVPSAIASRIECSSDNDVPIVGDGPAGIFVATATGLWRVSELPRVAPSTTDDQLFAWPPVERRTETPDPENPGWVTTVSIAKQGTGWCRYFTFITAHDGDAEICLRDGIIVSGSASSAGGDSREMRYTLVPA